MTGLRFVLKAMIACIEDHGGAIRANCSVREVVTDGTRASGVVLDSGERLSCTEGVIGAIHPHHLPDMVPAVPETVARNAMRTHVTPAACMTVHAALDAPLKFKARTAQGDDLSAVMYELMPGDYDDLRRAFDHVLTARAADIMTSAPITVPVGTLVEEVLTLMNDAKITVLFVTAQDDRAKPVGIAHIHDLAP